MSAEALKIKNIFIFHAEPINLCYGVRGKGTRRRNVTIIPCDSIYKVFGLELFEKIG